MQVPKGAQVPTVGMTPRVNVAESTMTSRLRDFMRINPSIFLGSKVLEDPQEFLDGVYKVCSAMAVTSRVKVELALYQLREVTQGWYSQWKDNRPVELGTIEWEDRTEALLGMYFPCERREVKVEKFINLKKGNMSVEEYSLKFTMLSKYAPSLLSNPTDEMSRFMPGSPIY